MVLVGCRLRQCENSGEDGTGMALSELPKEEVYVARVNNGWVPAASLGSAKLFP